jgi:membrane-bound inhibitor of C-type lysozyme
MLLFAGCSGMSIWPFGSKGEQLSGPPANATEYQCEGRKGFYVRDLENGAAAWLIYPDREVRLEKVAGAGTRYSNGIAVLDINGSEAILDDGPNIAYRGCKRGSKDAAPAK